MYRASRVPTETLFWRICLMWGRLAALAALCGRLRVLPCRGGLGVPLALLRALSGLVRSFVRSLSGVGASGCRSGSWYSIRWKIWLARSSSVTGRITSISFPSHPDP